MKAFLIVSGSLFALIVVLHFVRMRVEPQLAGDPWFWLTTVASAALSFWAFRLLQKSRRS